MAAAELRVGGRSARATIKKGRARAPGGGVAPTTQATGSGLGGRTVVRRSHSTFRRARQTTPKREEALSMEPSREEREEGGGAQDSLVASWTSIVTNTAFLRCAQRTVGTAGPVMVGLLLLVQNRGARRRQKSEGGGWLRGVLRQEAFGSLCARGGFFGVGTWRVRMIVCWCWWLVWSRGHGRGVL